MTRSRGEARKQARLRTSTRPLGHGEVYQKFGGPVNSWAGGGRDGAIRVQLVKIPGATSRFVAHGGVKVAPNHVKPYNIDPGAACGFGFGASWPL